jgi:hypothetical protein
MPLTAAELGGRQYLSMMQARWLKLTLPATVLPSEKWLSGCV